ncbi:helix-turn-helix domain-containing protein [Streptomyces sp. NPDC046465]|uniref:helix-turn-helix domain-containing protein n=1 Tax=Streptomyces sp. NPDC046465 TaxID=3155810 RepID=UPI0033EB770C
MPRVRSIATSSTNVMAGERHAESRDRLPLCEERGGRSFRHAVNSHIGSLVVCIVSVREEEAMSDLRSAVDALLARPADPLPPPAVRSRLRKAAGLTQEEVAKAFEVTRVAFTRWESGEAVPHRRRREAYALLLQGWAEKFPAAAIEPGRSDMPAP